MGEDDKNTGGLLRCFEIWKRDVMEVLASAAAVRREQFEKIHPLGTDSLERIVEYTGRGKMVRGGLVCLADGLVEGRVGNDARTAAAAVELFQSALLIHDDIMDRDEARRGGPSIHYHYQEAAEESGMGDPGHLGSSLGICAGDVAFFLGFELITEIEAPPTALRSIFSRCARELSYVGVAQMADVLRGSADREPPSESPIGRLLRNDDPERAVLEVYRYKTGRYTFSLPLMTGAAVGGAGASTIDGLERLGEELGILFQLKDDEIGLFGSEAETGKPVGSDIREGKKTLFYVYLMDDAEPAELDRLLPVFGNPTAADSEIVELLEVMESRGVRKRVMRKAEELAGSARDMIADLGAVDSTFKGLLEELVEYSLTRTR